MSVKSEKQKLTMEKLKKKTEKYPKFLIEFILRPKSAATSCVYFSYLKDMLEFFMRTKIIEKNQAKKITSKDLRKITISDIENYFDFLRRSNQKLSSIAAKTKVLRSFWEFLLTKKYVTEDIFLTLNSQKYREEKSNCDDIVKIPLKENIDFFISSIEKENNDFVRSRNKAIVCLFLSTGIRCEELLNLDISDIQTDGRNPFVLVVGKGKLEAKDIVPIIPAEIFLSSLNEYMEKRKNLLRGKTVKSNALFLSQAGNRLSKSYISLFFREYSQGKITPHSLRRYVGTLMYRKTNDLIAVQKQMRHKTIETTAKHYIRTDMETLSKAANCLSDFFGKNQ